MAAYTDSLGLEEITPGDQAGLWGNTTNNNLTLIDQAIAGVTPIYLDGKSGFTYELTYYNGAPDEARAAVINVIYASSPATGANIIQIPSTQKLYVFRNSSGQSIVVQTVAAGSTVTLANGEATLVFCDGTDTFPGIATSGVGTLTVPYGGTGVTSFGGSAGFVYTAGGTSALGVVTAINLSTSVTGTLPVANGGTGITSFPSGQILRGNNTGAMSTYAGSATNDVLTWTGSQWESRTPTTGAVTSVSGTGTVNGISLSGTVTSAGNLTLSGSLSGTASSLTAGAVTNGIYTNTANTLTSAGSITGTGTSIGDQRIGVSGAGLSSGMSPQGVQCGSSGWGLIYSSGVPELTMIAGGSFSTGFRTSGNFQSNNSPNWNTSSDINIKTNIRPISSALDKIKSLNPTHFEYKDRLGETQTGFIAQEFETIFPGHTIETPVEEKYKQFLPEGQTTIKALDLNLTGYLVKAIQELNAKVDAQAAEIAALKYPKTGA